MPPVRVCRIQISRIELAGKRDGNKLAVFAVEPSEFWINPPADGPEPRMLQLPRDTNFVEQLSHSP